jgi:hypothetical protein
MGGEHQLVEAFPAALAADADAGAFARDPAHRRMQALVGDVGHDPVHGLAGAAGDRPPLGRLATCSSPWLWQNRPCAGTWTENDMSAFAVGTSSSASSWISWG